MPMMNSLGKVVGGALLIAGTAAIWMWPKAKTPEAEAEPLRPVRSALVKDATTMPDLKFSGIVKAGDDRKLAFKQSGRIEKIPAKKGAMVKKGEKLAWLVPDDFKNRLAEAEAAAKRDRLTHERMSQAVKRNAISKEELSKAEANLKRSEAQLKLAQTALDETVLYAPFDSLVADVPPSSLDMVGPSTTVVVLLDLSSIKINAAVPESVVIQQPRFKCREDGPGISVTFDSAQGKSYPVEFVEYKATAEAKNQTFTATYKLPAPEGLVLLPGMSATILIPGGSYMQADGAKKAVEVPESAVGVDANGSYFVWVLTPETPQTSQTSQTSQTPQTTYTSHKRKLGKCEHVAGMVHVASGLAAGERVATAGVTVLSEGRRVTLMKDAAK